MAKVERNTRMTIVSVTKNEMVNLLASKAQELGLIDFTPDTIQVQEIDPLKGEHHIIFEAEIVETPPA